VANTNRQQFASDLTTKDATITTVLTVPVPNNSTVLLYGVMLARQSGGANSKGWLTWAVAKNNAGVVSMLPSSPANIATPIADAGASAVAATLAVNGANLVVTVTGVAGVTINWSVQADAVTVLD
jgi:hypothetical protein